MTIERITAVGTATLLHAGLAFAIIYGLQHTPPMTQIETSFEMVSLNFMTNEVEPVIQQITAPMETPTPATEITAAIPVKTTSPIKNTAAAITETVSPAIETIEPIAHTDTTQATPTTIEPPPIETNSSPALAASTAQPVQDNADLTAQQPIYTPPSSHADYLHNPKPFYPHTAKKRGIEGKVILAVMVNKAGQPITIKLHQSSGFRMLDKSAIKAVEQWRFEPARQAGLAVSGEVVIPIEFKLDS